jgi:hypothetical protein
VLGGFVTLPVTRWFELQPEVLYAMKGAQLQDSGIAARLLLDYLEVPVLGRLSRRVSDRIRLYAAGGPSFGLRVRAKTRAAFSGSTEEIDISEDVERYDLGVVAAGGLEMGSILVDGRYTLGLSDIDKDTSDSVKITTRAVSLTVGFRF